MKELKKTLVINLYSGPGAGKSTLAAWIFAKLKQLEINVELVTEYAKDKVWEESYGILNNQIYMFSKQHHKLNRVLGKVDVIITDSPIMMGVCYDLEDNLELKKLVYSEYLKMNNLNYFLNRTTNYEEIGRNQNLEEAIEMDKIIYQHLLDYDIQIKHIDVDKKSRKKLLKKIVKKINKHLNI